MGEAEKAPKPRLRWYQYRLAHLFVLAFSVLVCCGCRKTTPKPPVSKATVKKATAEEQTISEIAELRRIVTGSPVMTVDFSSTNVSDDDLVHLNALPNLKELFLEGGTKVTDDETDIAVDP